MEQIIHEDVSLSTTLAPSPAPEPLLERIQDLYDRGLYLQAFEASREKGPLKDWTGPEWRILAGRLAGNLGAPRLAAWHLIKAWRLHLGFKEAAWYYARRLADLHGTLTAWSWMRRLGDFPEEAARVRGAWLSLHAHVLARLRDFDAAERWLARAEAISPNQGWICIEKAFLLIQEDRPEEALEAARKSLEIRPWYRPGVQEVGHLLVQLGRDQEALDFLRDAAPRLESSAVWYQLAALQLELRHYHDARQSLEEVERFSPLLEKEFGQAIHARLSDAAYYCGDTPRAIELAKRCEGKFHEELAGRLENPPPEARRVLLDVPFVRQNFQTCVPATLVAVSGFWKMPGDHLEVAAEICYDGTPHHSERRWAEENDWVAREFTVTWEAARALLDRGLPFTLATADPGNAHLQGVIGYDQYRGSLLIREPSDRHLVEFAVERFLKHYAPTGPRGMVLVPRQYAYKLEGINLPDAALYDELYQLQRALHIHDRSRAMESLRRVEELAANHYVTWLARRALAQYDGDLPTLLACAEGMLALFPESLMWHLTRVNVLRQLGRHQERLELLRDLATRKPTDPMCWQQYAQELSHDARRHDEALFWLRRAHRVLPSNAYGVAGIARIRWDQGAFATAVELDRFAYCLADKDEALARNYFVSARSQGQAEEALEFLRRRFRRYGKQSGQPVRTLFWALSQLERHEESFQVLKEARVLRPLDGDLALFSAEMHGAYGQFAQAQEYLELARGKAASGIWARAEANLASYQGKLGEALEGWCRVLKAEPLAMDAHGSVARLLAETESRQAAQEHLRATREKFPNHYGLHQLQIEYLRDEGDEKLEPHVRQFLAIHPDDAWARRELALTLSGLARNEEALAEISHAETLEPFSALSKTIKGRILVLMGRVTDGQAVLKEAIRLSVDFDLALRELVMSCDTQTERRQALKFIEGELVRQTILGEGLLVFREYAQNNLDDGELLALLRKAWEARPDLWHAWSALGRQLNAMGQPAEALHIAQEAVRRFPLLPALWLDLALIQRDRRDRPAEIQALRKALEINPGYTWALRQLGQAYEDTGDPEKARQVLDSAIAHAPLQPANHQSLAEWLWRHEQRQEALDRILLVLRLDPGQESAWTRLNDWSARLDEGATARQFARELCQLRPAEVRSWLFLARGLRRQEEIEECLAALDRAIGLRPNSQEAHDLRAEVLAQAGRFEEALDACRPAILGAPPPLLLQARAAWVEQQQGKMDEAIRRMEEVVAQDANYQWAWQNLGDWYQARGDFANYLRAGEALLRLNPHSPLALAFCGEARLRLGNKEQGKELLAQAHALDPAYPLAGLLLFDEQLAAGESDAARDTLQHLQTHVGGAYVLAREVKLLVHDGEKDQALGRLGDLCLQPAADPWPITSSLDEVEKAGWQAEARAVLEEALSRESYLKEVPILLAERFPPRDEAETTLRLNSIERALLRYPTDWKLHDVKADLFANAGRFEEAIRACHPPDLKPQPVFLRGREAWIEQRRGNLDRAFTLMRACVAENPSYHWAWSCLCQWYEEQGNFKQWEGAARGMIQAAPQDPVAHVQLALARRAQGEKVSARQALMDALERAPAYGFAAQNLFDWSMEDGSPVHAKKALDLLENQSDSESYHYRAVLWYAKAKDGQGVARHLMAWCRLGTERLDQLEGAIVAADRAGLSNQVDQVLNETMVVNSIIGECWAKRRAQLDGQPPGDQEVLRLFPELPARAHALVGAALAASASRRGDIVLGILARHEKDLKTSTADWGNFGYALSTFDLPRQTVDWLSDYESRADVKPWMIHNLALAQMNLGFEEQAYQTCRFAVQLPPDHTRSIFELYLAGFELLGQEVEDGIRRLARLQPKNLTNYHLFVHGLLSAVATMEQAAPLEREILFSQVGQEWAAAAERLKPVVVDKALKRIYRKAVDRVAQLRGGLWARLWAWFRKRIPLLPR